MEAERFHYLHASVHQFDETACAAICKDLQNALKDARIHCEYDVDLHLFYITGPSELGCKANDHLATVLRNHIKRAAEDYKPCLVDV
jgi:hypothetical protein